MKELSSRDLFEVGRYADAVCIPTNGIVRSDGKAVMGRGVALAAQQRWPNIPAILANKLAMYGNVPNLLGSFTPFGAFDVYGTIGVEIWSFPTKDHWKAQSDLSMIEQSAHHMIRHANERELRIIVLPRPGCGNGQLRWPDVRAVISLILDKRFIVVSNDSI